MHEYTIYNVNTKQEDILMGHTFSEAMEKAGLDPNIWHCIMAENIDADPDEGEFYWGWY